MNEAILSSASWIAMAFYFYVLFRIYTLLFKEIKNITVCFVTFVAAYVVSALQWHYFHNVWLMLGSNLLLYILIAMNFKAKWYQYILAGIGSYLLFSLIETLMMLIFTLLKMDILHNEYYQLWGTALNPLVTYVIISGIIQHRAIKDLPYLKVRHSALFGIVVLIIFGIAVVLPYIGAKTSGSMFIGSTGLIMIVIFLFAFMDSLVMESKERAAKLMFEMQSRLYSNELDMVKKYQYEIKTIRHDIDHHIQTLNDLLSKKEYTNAEAYVKGLVGMTQIGFSPINTGLSELDSIINYKVNQAGQADIKVNSAIKVEETCYIAPPSYISVIGNLMDNAIEATEHCTTRDKRWIDISVGIVKGNFFIEIINPYCTELTKEGDKYLTTKEEKSDHGFGLAHVKDIVKRIGGTLEILDEYQGETLFNVKVLLHNRPQ